MFYHWAILIIPVFPLGWDNSVLYSIHVKLATTSIASGRVRGIMWVAWRPQLYKPFLEEVGFGLGSKKGYDQLHCSHQHFSHATVMVSDLLPNVHPLRLLCCIFPGKLLKFKSDHNVKALLWLSKVRAEALCGLALPSPWLLPSSFLPFAPSTPAMLSSILFPSSTVLETLSHMTCHLFVYSLSHLHENSKLLRTR